MNAVVMNNVVKRYGPHLALNGLSLTIPKGSICALIGPNGCGKTTTMGVVAGLLQVESGHVDILERGPFEAKAHAGRVALMPQDAVPSTHVPIIESLRRSRKLPSSAQFTAASAAMASIQVS